MRQALVLMKQITLADVRNAVAHLDVPTFIRQTAPLVPSAPDVPNDEDTKLVRALLEVPLGVGTTLPERLAPYIHAGVTSDWQLLVLRLRVRGASALVHPEAVFSGEYIFDDNKNIVPAPRLLGPRDRLLTPRARTLRVVLERKPGGSDLAHVPPAPGARAPDALFNALVAELDKRVRPTVGGDAFLAPDPAGRALSVLAATVATVLGDRACQRWAGKARVVRADVYQRLFTALDLDPYFDVAREVLERDHPHRRGVVGPWPPGDGLQDRDLGILLYDEGYLTLSPTAVLRSVPLSIGYSDSMAEEQGEEDGDEE
jgi:hypothetical protein